MIIFSEQFDQDLQILQVTVADEITLTLCATSQTAGCPDCGTISTRIQSRYSRTLHDLPNRRRPVHLVLQVRRFRCQKSTCARKIFAEQFPHLARPYAQRTLQLQESLCHVGIALGGQAGTLLGSQLGLSGSRDTILRLLRAAEPPAAIAPKKVGIDDWAWKRGHRYGTIVCDLERGIPIDLLPDRSVDTVAAWFVAHPSIELVSRDGSSEYAAAARKGAPQAIQVSDRWHILKNLAKALQVLLTSHFTAQRKKKTQEAGKKQEFAFSQDRERRLSSQQTHIQNRYRQDRLARYEQVIALAKQGMSQEVIARVVGVGHSTVSRWLRVGAFPERKPREQASQIDRYRRYVQKRQAEGYQNLMGIYRELQSLGYQGSYATLHAQFAKSSSSKMQTKQVPRLPLTPALPSTRRATWLFLRRPEELTTQEQEMVKRLRLLHSEVDLAYLLVQQFVQMVRKRTGEQLDAWLEAVTESSLTDLQSFANGVSEDKDAIFAGLTKPESNGPTEGHVTRLKLIKRSMYGRAQFNLLRLRVLSRSQKTYGAKMEGDHKRRRGRTWRLSGGENLPNSQHSTFRVSEVA